MSEVVLSLLWALILSGAVIFMIYLNVRESLEEIELEQNGEQYERIKRSSSNQRGR